MSDEPSYIIRGYNPHTYGCFSIKAEDVVRPFTFKYTQEVARDYNWNERSMVGHATYGTCVECFMSGPVWHTCHTCGEDQVYTLLFFGHEMLDSVTLSNRLELGHLVAKANRTFNWTQPAITFVNIEWLQAAVGHNRTHTKENRNRIFNKVMDMLPPDQSSTPLTAAGGYRTPYY